MAIEHYPRETSEYLPVVVDGDEDLNTLVVEMSVVAYGIRPTMWVSAQWDVDDDGATIAKVKIGPGSSFDFSASPGTKVPWVRVTTSDEVPVLEGDPIQIT
ncbi:hypothetical protein OG884_18740 [Streptosporangium sp. NBC_01755]|uniref:hypothetical protein n=1 Tax=Streptosporangium sp. NBC_01755 TaxID=2975949 RepID=UPI002DDBE100|nr:hypothetical protein [Streptosporangium sp. NBC_01755]WSD01450.1 hypothetical protein OG884_05855 [Streptosporangium sp. NBC_01755]WSD03846.1 hypothetical protein OG884_18740 [Streptosporangium sp. NBC_01755]